ncbi:hypothetical protein M3J09_003451 [Ascochyta lentis]
MLVVTSHLDQQDGPRPVLEHIPTHESTMVALHLQGCQAGLRPTNWVHQADSTGPCLTSPEGTCFLEMQASIEPLASETMTWSWEADWVVS